MSIIINEEYLCKRIMENNRHQFIYGYNGIEREKKLKLFVSQYPFSLNNPVGIYIQDSGLIEIPNDKKDLDEILINIFNECYFDFLLASNMIDKILEQPIDNSDEVNFVNKFNKLFLNKNFKPISNLQELREILILAKDTYSREYEHYILSGNKNNFVDSLPISFMMMDLFIKRLKNSFKMNSFFGIIIDQQNPITIKTQQVINGYINSRINADISMKVACHPGEWKTYYSMNGQYIENIHDYSIIEVDECFERIMKKHKI